MKIKEKLKNRKVERKRKLLLRSYHPNRITIVNISVFLHLIFFFLGIDL